MVVPFYFPFRSNDNPNISKPTKGFYHKDTIDLWFMLRTVVLHSGEEVSRVDWIAIPTYTAPPFLSSRGSGSKLEVRRITKQLRRERGGIFRELPYSLPLFRVEGSHILCLGRQPSQKSLREGGKKRDGRKSYKNPRLFYSAPLFMHLLCTVLSNWQTAGNGV